MDDVPGLLLLLSSCIWKKKNGLNRKRFIISKFFYAMLSSCLFHLLPIIMNNVPVQFDPIRALKAVSSGAMYISHKAIVRLILPDWLRIHHLLLEHPFDPQWVCFGFHSRADYRFQRMLNRRGGFHSGIYANAQVINTTLTFIATIIRPADGV
jgi:hypothetical protein